MGKLEFLAAVLVVALIALISAFCFVDELVDHKAEEICMTRVNSDDPDCDL